MSSVTRTRRDPMAAGDQKNSLLRDAYAVLLPAYADIDFEATRGFLEAGGISILLGSTREEYVARRMDSKRQQTETIAGFESFSRRVRSVADNVLVALDHELGGVQRLQGLAPTFAAPADVLAVPASQIEAHGRAVGKIARRLGVNLILAPVLDLTEGPNPWLSGRTLSPDASVVAEYASAYIRGLQSERVAATAKHFPGHPVAELDPNDHEEASVPVSIERLRAGFPPFAAAIASGVKAIMTGPMVVSAIDSVRPASLSPVVVNMLRTELQFKGLVISDDLDAKGTLRGRSIRQAAIDSLSAGVDLLLLAGGPQVDGVANEIASAAIDGRLEPDRLTSAARAVRDLAAHLA